MLSSTPRREAAPAIATKSAPRRNTENYVALIDWDNVYQVTTLLRGELVHMSSSLLEVSNKTGLHTQTIRRIRDGETKEPRTETTLGLLKFFDYKVQIRRD